MLNYQEMSILKSVLNINFQNLEPTSANQKRIDMIIRPRDRREVARYEIIAYTIARLMDTVCGSPVYKAK